MAIDFNLIMQCKRLPMRNGAPVIAMLFNFVRGLKT